MQGGATEHAGQHDSARRTDFQQPRLMIEPLAGQLGQGLPQFVRAPNHWHVIGVLEVGLANQPRLAVRAAAIVPQGKAIQPEHLRPALGQMIEGRTADPADSEHDCVVGHS